jgi:hypothetical protein
MHDLSSENLKERNHLGKTGVNWRKILKAILTGYMGCNTG